MYSRAFDFVNNHLPADNKVRLSLSKALEQRAMPTPPQLIKKHGSPLRRNASCGHLADIKKRKAKRTGRVTPVLSRKVQLSKASTLNTRIQVHEPSLGPSNTQPDLNSSIKSLSFLYIIQYEALSMQCAGLQPPLRHSLHPQTTHRDHSPPSAPLRVCILQAQFRI